MLPPIILQDYPHFSRGLQNMLGAADTSERQDGENQQAIAAELTSLMVDDSAFNTLFDSLWNTFEASPCRLLEFSSGAYYHLGVGDEVRDFLGRLWRVAMIAWDETTQQDFLLRILREYRYFLFQALDIVPPIFQDVPIDAEFMASWVKEARRAVGNDMYQRGLWRSFQTYAQHQSGNALQLIESTFADSEDPQFRTVLARMLSWIRSSRLEASALRELERIESKLRMTGAPNLRSVYLESWGYEAGTEALDEARALALRDEFLGINGEQMDSWTFVLAQTVGANYTGWHWAYRELKKLTNCQIDATARGWIIAASLAGWTASRMESPITRNEWADLFFSLPPIDEGEVNIWRHIEHSVVDMLAADPEAAKQFLLRLAFWSGKAWAKLLEVEREHYSWLNTRLRDAGHAQTVITALCFTAGRAARRVGVKMFEKCHLTGFTSETLAAATANQLELLILQTTLGYIEHRAIARIHASIARRIDELGGDLAETFYDNVIIEALNTHGYREALTQHAEGHARLLECIAEAHRRIDATIAAHESPAFKMLVPGQARAEVLGMRRMSRLIQKGASENSLLLQMCTTIPVLYGRTWRFLDAADNLTMASEMTKSQVSTELPRLEYVTPEQMRFRRLAASARIDELEQNEGDD